MSAPLIKGAPGALWIGWCLKMWAPGALCWDRSTTRGCAWRLGLRRVCLSGMSRMRTRGSSPSRVPQFLEFKFEFKTKGEGEGSR